MRCPVPRSRRSSDRRLTTGQAFRRTIPLSLPSQTVRICVWEWVADCRLCDSHSLTTTTPDSLVAVTGSPFVYTKTTRSMPRKKLSDAIVPMSTSETSPLTGPVNEFTVSLFHRLSSSQGRENVFLSPFSVSTALSMLLLGARNESEEQIRKALMFQLLENSDIHCYYRKLTEDKIRGKDSVLLSNYVLIQKVEGTNEILSHFKSQLSSSYSAQVDDVNFSADGPVIMTTVNDWVKDRTKGLIATILNDPPDSDTRLLLLNAIYFRGKWKSPFEKEMTRKMTFFNNGREEVDTEFMTTYDTKFGYLTERMGGEAVQVLEMPYQEEDMSLVIVLPEQRNGLQKLLTADSFRDDLSRVFASLSDSTSSESMNLFIPKFKLETEYPLIETLSELGMTDIFTPAADLSGINGSKDLFVSSVKHKATVIVDEEGTEAAAVTAIGVRCYCLMPTTDFRAEHPFLFFIRDKSTGIVLFIGKVESF